MRASEVTYLKRFILFIINGTIPTYPILYEFTFCISHSFCHTIGILNQLLWCEDANPGFWLEIKFGKSQF